MRISRLIPPIIAALLLSNTAHAVVTHTKVWLDASFTGSLSEDKKIKFFIDPEVRFIDDKYKFQNTLLWLGIGYQLASNLVVFVGDAPATIRTSRGFYRHENILWQQATWTISDSANYKLISRSRIDETKNNHASPWGILLRERLQFKYPLKNWENHAIVVSDEIFFNPKNVYWRAHTSFVAQNRAYVGLERKLSKITSVSIGYLNQFQFTNPNQMSNVLQVGMEMNFG